MIHHYINLVCWPSMLEIYQPERDFVWVDTLSLSSLLNRFGFETEYRPGHYVLRDIGPNKEEGVSWFFLTSTKIRQICDESQFVLPFLTEVVVSEELKQSINRLKPGTRVGIGISSPKQNLLAVKLHTLRPDLEFHCLGAALSELGHIDQGRFKTYLLSNKGFGLLWFFCTSPRRTVTKLAITFKSIFQIMSSASHADDFLKFAKICEPSIVTHTDVNKICD